MKARLPLTWHYKKNQIDCVVLTVKGSQVVLHTCICHFIVLFCS